MAIRNILNEREDALHRVCRPVTNFDERLWQLLDDMAETLHKADGCGLAAPQVGILRYYPPPPPCQAQGTEPSRRGIHHGRGGPSGALHLS